MAYSITPRIAAELIFHEGIAREAYLDAGDVWTWGIGVTNASGHEVAPRYRDRPTDIATCLRVFISILRDKYVPDVETAFAGAALAEHEFAAILSFHYNTGAILTASWVQAFLAGDMDTAREQFLLWKKPSAVIARRHCEHALLFDGRWASNGRAQVFGVRKPSYKIDLDSVEDCEVFPRLRHILGQDAVWNVEQGET